MATGFNNASNKKSNSSKPYDASNSFVKKVASRVTGLIPQTKWLSGWFSSTNETTERPDSPQNPRFTRDDDNFEDCLDQQPPSKRIKLPDRNYESDIYMSSGSSKDGKKSSQEDIMDMSSVPGPSGQQRVVTGFVSSTPAEQDRRANGDDCSESGESTSGCSSLEPQMNRVPGAPPTQGRPAESLSTPSRFLDDRFNYPSYLQSPRTLFLERSSGPRGGGQSASRRKPSFCVTSLNSSLFGDRSLNETMVNSPFYSGRTMYGGASSSPYRRSVGSTSFSSSPANSDKMGRRTVKVKASPAPGNVDTGMSETARRILATLEQFSTPLMDAKRIPVNASPQPVLASNNRKRARQDTDEPKIMLNSPRSPHLSRKGVHWAAGPAGPPGPPLKELTVPSSPDTLLVHRKERLPSAAGDSLLRQKERLQDSTTAARRLANSVPASNFGLERTYTLRSGDDESAPAPAKQSLKMKSQSRTKNHQSNNWNEQAETVNLPKIALPITTLPSFDIPIAKAATPSSLAAPAPSAASPSMAAPSAVAPKAVGRIPEKMGKAPTPPASGAPLPFTFASPIVVASDTKMTSPVTFVFSSPDSVSEEKKAPTGGINFLSSVPCKTDKPALKRKSVTVKENGSDSAGFGLKPASELRTGSVMDILGKGAKDAKEVSVNGSVSLMDKWKPAAGSWECDQCLIRNKADAPKCVACTAPRPAPDGKGTSNESRNTAASAAAPAASGASTPAADTSFGLQFKLSGSDMWECSSCMVRNKSASSSCAACGGAKTPKASQETPKATSTATPATTGWGDKFKPATNTWECEACMVRNAADLTACQACTTKRPGGAAPAAASAATPTPTTNTTPLASSWGDKFKKPQGSWNCSDCMITNTSSALKCVACGAKKAGVDAVDSDTSKVQPSFSFGIPPATETSASTSTAASATSGFSFGSKPSDKPASGFRFGESAVSAPAATFTFGIPTSSSTAASPSAPPATTTTSTASTDKPSFSFGVPPQSSDATPKSTETTTEKAVTFNLAQSSPETSEPSRKRKSTMDPVAPSESKTPLAASPSTGNLSKPDNRPIAAPLFGFTDNRAASPATSAAASPAAVSLFKFGADSSAGSASASATTSTVSAEPPKPSQDVKSMFSSGTTPVFAFGQATADPSKSAEPPKAAEATPVAKPVFVFGQAASDSPKAAEASKPVTFGAEAAKPSFSFGQLSSEAAKPVTFGASGDAASAAKPAFAFKGAAEATSKSLTTFGSPPNTSAAPHFRSGIAFPSFASASSTAGSATTVTTFGSTPAAPAAPAAVTGSLFGSLSAAGTAAPAAPTTAFGSAFGAVDKAENKQAGVFTFGGAKPPGGALFTFGAAPSSGPAAAPPTATAPAPASSPAVNGPSSQKAPEFVFSSQSAAPKAFTAFSAPAPSQGFNFGSTAPVFGAAPSAAAAPAPAAANAQPLFGVTCAFGAPAQQPAFNAQAPASQLYFPANPQPQPQPTPGVFSFGGTQPSQNAAPASPFSFSKPPTFNPNAAPNFNFTAGGAVNFTATPGEGKPMPQRVIKRAMRRSTPR